jgi:hypothetical protein
MKRFTAHAAAPAKAFVVAGISVSTIPEHGSNIKTAEQSAAVYFAASRGQFRIHDRA